MSTLSVTTITTENATTPLRLQTGNSSGPVIALSSSNTDITITGNVTTGNVVISSTGLRIAGDAVSAAGSFRNRLINGSMDIWQRGTSFSNMGSTTSYTADRWSCYRLSYTTNITVSQITGLTIGTGINRIALRTQRTAGDTSAAGLYATQSIESINSRDLAGQSITMSFYARVGANFSSSALGAAIYSGTGTDQSVRAGITGIFSVADVGFTPSTTFVRYTLTGTVPANANQLAVAIYFIPAGTAGANDWFDITDVQLEAGTIATPFERRPFGQELALCQRYFEKSFTLGVAPANGANATSFIDTQSLAACVAMNSGYGGAFFPFKVSKRAAPTITAYGNSSGFWGYGSTSGAPTFNASAFSPVPGENGMLVTQQVVNNAFQWIVGHWTAAIEL